jgi:ABC transport system ATP-binding/permease protein
MQLEEEQKLVGRVAIQFMSGPLAGEIIPITKPVTEIGRDEQNDIVICDAKVSRHHARICWLDGSWTIENLSQRSFISINQQRIQQSILQHNSVVNLGEDNTFVFLLQSPVQQSLSSSTVIKVPAHIPRDASPTGTVIATSGPSLIVSSNVHSHQQVYALKADVQVFNIGRDPINTIAIDESIVSAQHVQIIREGSNLVLVHPHPARGKTLNGLWYQGRHINGNEQFKKQLEYNDVFRIGDEHGRLVTLSYDDGTGTPLETMPAMQAIPLNSSRLTIGREFDNTVVLNHPQVSAHHAVLEKVESGYRIIDTNSTNPMSAFWRKVDGLPISVLPTRRKRFLTRPTLPRFTRRLSHRKIILTFHSRRRRVSWYQQTTNAMLQDRSVKGNCCVVRDKMRWMCNQR